MTTNPDATTQAQDESASYVWEPSNKPGFVYCLAQSEEVYEVSKGTCTCPAHTFHQTDCKHIKAYRQRLGLPERVKVKGYE